jgi:hypothetical protein
MSVTWLLSFCILTTNQWIVAVCSSASLRDILGRKRTWRALRARDDHTPMDHPTLYRQCFGGDPRAVNIMSDQDAGDRGLAISYWCGSKRLRRRRKPMVLR